MTSPWVKEYFKGDQRYLKKPPAGSVEGDIVEYNGTDWVNGRRTRFFPAGYVAGNDYQRGDEVSNGNQISEAIVDGASQYPFVTPTGSEYAVYTGIISDTSDTAKQVIFGNRYTFGAGGYISGYRIYAVTDQSYSVFAVRDPDGERVVTELLAFIAKTDGWVEIGLPVAIVPEGTVIDLMAQVQEPAATPVTFTGNWNYTTPNNEGVPATGGILQSNKAPASLRISKTDDDGGDRSTELEALSAGDNISGAGVTWAIQSSTDNTTWMDFSVSPAVQGAPDGVQSFSFETVAATPIQYGEDIGWWTGNPPPKGLAQGMLSVGGAYNDIVPNGNAYGTDITVQEAYLPTDWWVKVISGSAGGVSSLSARDMAWVSASSTLIDKGAVSTTNNDWTEVSRRGVEPDTILDGRVLVKGTRTDQLDAFRGQIDIIAYRDTGALQVSFVQDYEVGNSHVDVRAIADANDVLVEVKGRNNELWDWDMSLFYMGR